MAEPVNNVQVQARDTAVWPGASADPVFVLCCGRSGSTLLRFLLDAHPDLACPPETFLPWLCAQLVRVWNLMDTGGRENCTAVAPEVLTGVRETIDRIVGPHLSAQGKKRYCDKNLGTASHADAVTRVFPDAKFLCLYRHPMDMIASGIEACAWGLNSYGFDSYAAASPQNNVLAVARYWADYTSAILSVEERFPERCHRIRYEDLVADPEHVMGEVFSFIGVPPMPGVSSSCFTRRERIGRGDRKIWDTSKVSHTSVGRGWQVPADMIPAPATERLNSLARKLHYVQISKGWGNGSRPDDMRVGVGQGVVSHAVEGTAKDVMTPPVSVAVTA
ncbi:MAG TPA: sulfotransferase [Streptosporangiaceae bacterium]|nr:sulfotransferase [Streptosporangiaceae bacterium]